MRVLAVAIVCLLSLLGPAAAEDDKEPKKAAPKSLTVEAAADAVLKAVDAGDSKALKALAQDDGPPDRWRVANELCYRGEHDAAEAFAKAARGVDVQALPAYIEAWRKREPDKAEQELAAAMSAALKAGRWLAIIERTASLAGDIDTMARIRLAHIRGVALRSVGRLNESATVLRRAAKAARALGWLHRSSWLYADAGLSASRNSDWESALASWQARLTLEDQCGKKVSAAVTARDIGRAYSALGKHKKALLAYEGALARKEELGDKVGATRMLSKIARVYEALGDYAKALSVHERALAQQEALGDKHGAAATLGNIGAAYARLGDFAKALSTLERALAQQEALGDKRVAAVTLGNIGLAYDNLGHFAKALSTFDSALAQMQALGAQVEAAWMLMNIGRAHSHLGMHAQGLRAVERALAQQQALGDKHGEAHALTLLGGIHTALGEHAKALSTLERALRHHRALGNKQGEADTLCSIGRACRDLGKYGESLSSYERALAQMQALGDKGGATWALWGVGWAHRMLGNVQEARKAFERVAREARRLRADPALAIALGALALVHLEAGESSRALWTASQVLDVVESMFAGLGAEHGAAVRAQFTDLYAVGVLAAVRERDAPRALTFLESGRAGALLDVLDRREVLRWKAESLPDDIRRQDQHATLAQTQARRRYSRALESGDRREIRRARRALNDATNAVRHVADRIQRELKQQAGLFYPRAETIENIQSTLEDDQALVLYGLCLNEALALVLRPDGERVVSLGKVADVEAACVALDASDPGVDPSKALAVIKRLLVDPLQLGKDVKHVLVSPEGPLCYVPFGALFDRTVCMTPSGTTHVLLLDEERKAGDGVLALGNPDYSGVSEGAKAIYFRGLSPLPATAPEVKAVGTTTLLGAKASEAGLRESLKARERWKAVHFACHGLIDVERPMLSSLALSATGQDDGFLTALEVLRMEIPADLAVLSACETGKGKVVKGEGIVGMTRAFMFAGAPRVVCSLWKVDDEATKALMIKFYELWSPKEGKGLGAAEALKTAQAHVRAQEKWKHPYYWAAWVLWGLPE